MGSYTFQWPYTANEVFVTGTFDDWGKTVKLDRVGDHFAKEVSLPIKEKIQYKFVVDGIWTTDKKVREENDGSDNINNVLLSEEIQTQTPPTQTPNTDLDPSNQIQPTTATADMSGVTPDSTTAALAAKVPKELPTREQVNGSLPGAFPDTPGQESDKILSVNPIPASGGIGNPIKLNPGEKVPDPSTIHGNTVESTVKLDQASYEKGDSVPLGSAGTQSDTAGPSAFSLPPVSKTTIPESSLPMGGPAQRAATTAEEQKHAGGPAQQAAMADHDYTIQSAAPGSTTAALAAQVPLEKDIANQTNGTAPVDEVPAVVKDSIAEAHRDPEAAANKEAVEEKKDVEEELQKKVDIDESAGTPAPTETAAQSVTAPGATTAGATAAVLSTGGFDSANVSPTSSPPPGHAAPTSAPPTSEPKATEDQAQPTVTSGAETVPTKEVSSPKPSGGVTKEQKKKHRLSGFFSKLKEKLK
ncbi:hypothetical protein N7488_001314 [Penicillium malachiteum]|nr:hypothetical protein N7488_001314 [Penicillium malachiteum]